MYAVEEWSGTIYSECDRTMVGWYGPANPQDHSNRGCFYGVKDDASDYISSQSPATQRWVSPASFLQTQLFYEDHESLITHIN